MANFVLFEKSNKIHLCAHNDLPLCVASSYDRYNRDDKGGFTRLDTAGQDIELEDVERPCQRCLARAKADYVSFRPTEGIFFVDEPELHSRTQADYDQMLEIDKKLYECKSAAELDACFAAEKVNLTGKKLEVARGWRDKFKEKRFPNN